MNNLSFQTNIGKYKDDSKNHLYVYYPEIELEEPYHQWTRGTSFWTSFSANIQIEGEKLGYTFRRIDLPNRSYFLN